MSGKRFNYDNGEFTDTTTEGIPFHGGYACDLLNRQAKDLEVLREWILDCGKQMIRDEKEIIDDPEFSTPKDVTVGKRRIAALEET